MPRALLLGFLLPAIFLLQACVPVATSVVAYDSSISFQEHGAYTEYLFATQAKNQSLQQAGEPIMPEKMWRKDVYRLRLQYAEYYTRQTATNGQAHSFEVWKQIDYPQEEENVRMHGRAPNDRFNLK
jgi:predicted membrane-bound dolichyl-phosphate-mannose-protein mannosyltransferase